MIWLLDLDRGRGVERVGAAPRVRPCGRPQPIWAGRSSCGAAVDEFESGSAAAGAAAEAVAVEFIGGGVEHQVEHEQTS